MQKYFNNQKVQQLEETEYGVKTKIDLLKWFGVPEMEIYFKSVKKVLKN